jgi:hypothetical protein
MAASGRTDGRTGIRPGIRVRVRGGSGRKLVKRAVTGVVDGRDFPVVRACSEEEWTLAQREGREPDGVAWPAEDVEAISE